MYSLMTIVASFTLLAVSLLGVGALVARAWSGRMHARPVPAPVAVGA
jgi:hypothetical protein